MTTATMSPDQYRMGLVAGSAASPDNGYLLPVQLTFLQNQQISFVLTMSLQAPECMASWTDQVLVKSRTGDRRQVIIEFYPAKLYDWRTSPSSGFQFCVALEEKKVAIWSES